MIARALIVSLLLAAAPVARAQPESTAVATAPTPFSLGLDLHTQWHLDRSHQLFSEDRATGATGLTLAYDLASFAGGTLALAAGWQHEGDQRRWASATPEKGDGASATLGELASLDLDTLSVSAIVRWSLTSWLEPLVRVAADGTWAAATLRLDDRTSFESAAFSPGGSAGAGLRLRTPSTRVGLPGRPLFAAAATVEAGFHAGAALSFNAHPRPTSDEKKAADQIPIGDTALGSLDQAEPYLRVSLAVLF
jgi:hypothetical protein